MPAITPTTMSAITPTTMSAITPTTMSARMARKTLATPGMQPRTLRMPRTLMTPRTPMWITPRTPMWICQGMGSDDTAGMGSDDKEKKCPAILEKKKPRGRPKKSTSNENSPSDEGTKRRSGRPPALETPEDMKAKRKLFEASLLKIAKDGGIDGLIVFSDWMVKVFNFLVDFCSNIEKSSPYFFMVMEWYKARHMGFLGAITVVAGIVLASILTKFLKSVQPKRKKPQKKPQQQD